VFKEKGRWKLDLLDSVCLSQIGARRSDARPFSKSSPALKRFNYVDCAYKLRCSLQVSLWLGYGRFFVTNLRTARCNISPYSGMFYAAKSGMNAPTKILLTLTAAAALSLAQPASANLITNPGFETGDFTGWTHIGGLVGGLPASHRILVIFRRDSWTPVHSLSPLRRHLASPTPLTSFWPPTRAREPRTRSASCGAA